MSGPYGPNENAGQGGADPTQFGGQQQPAPQWGQQAPAAQTPQPGTPGQAPQQDPAAQTQQWTGQQPAQPWTNPGAPSAQQQWGGQQPANPPADPTQWAGQQQQPQTPPADATQWAGQQQAGQQWGAAGAQPADATQWGGQQQQQGQWGQQPGQDQWSQQQQQFGQGQPFPQQQPAGSGKSKAPLFILIGVVVLALIGGVVAAVVLLGSKDKLDQSKAQEGVKKVLDESYAIKDVSDVQCGSDMKVEVGKTYSCDLKVSGDSKKVDLKITKDDGTYEVSRPKSA